MVNFKGVPYPITKTTKGYLYPPGGVNQSISDMLILLLTNPGERVMNPNFGTPLRKLLFEPNDPTTALAAKTMIINSIKMWEPRIAIQNINVSTTIDKSVLNPADNGSEVDHILFIQIIFVDPQNIQSVQELTLEVPLGGS